MNTNSATFQSRWGFHPCSYALFLQIKRLHKSYWQAVYDFHSWHRWQRKLPHNRIGPEPKFCPLFVKESIWYKAVRNRGIAGFRVYPKMIVDHGIVILFQQARTPQPQLPALFDDATLRQIEAAHAALLAYNQ